MAAGADEDVGVLLVDLDAPAAGTADPAPDPARHLSRRRRHVVAAAVVALLVVVLGDLAAAGHPAPSAPTEPVTAEGLYSVLAQPQVLGTGLPRSALASSTDVAHGSERLVAVAPDAAFWVGRGESGQLCLVVVPSRTDRVASGGCAAPASVAARGLRVTTGGGPSAVLLPVGSDSTATAAAGYAQLAPGLWVDLGTARRAALVRARSASLQTVVVPAEAHRGSAPLAVMLTEAGVRYSVVLTCLRPAPLRVGLAGTAVPARVPRGGPARP